MNKYIIDTNVLIDFNDSLPMDVYITQWKMIGENIENGKIIICEAVFGEIKKSVELKQWLEKYKKLIEPCYSDKVLIEAKVIINNYPKLIEINNPSDQSDPYVIALAKLNSFTVLTNEKYSVGGKKTRIPFICKEMSIKCINTHEFYRTENWKF
jgi:hypothetical protein